MAATATSNKGRTTGLSFDIRGVFDVTRDLRGLESRLPYFQERAMRTLGRRLPVEARRDIQAEYNVPAARVRDHLRAVVLTGDSGARVGGIRLVGQWKRGIGLIQFSARQTRKGVSYSVYLGRRQLEASAFIARMRSGNMHVVQRYGTKTWRRTYRDRHGKSRTRMDQPIEVQYRSTVAQMLARGRRPDRLRDFAGGVLAQDYQRQIDSYLRRPSRSR